MGEIRVRVQPRARRTEIVGERGGALVVRVSVVRGLSGRDKTVRVDGVEDHAIVQALLRSS